MNRLRIPLELLAEAWMALRENRPRSSLSVIGIAVGIAAVMTVNAVSSGGRVFVIKELETFGLRSVWVFRDYADKDPTAEFARVRAWKSAIWHYCMGGAVPPCGGSVP